MLYTATEVAEQINATKPDFKHFKELFTIDDVNKFKEDFDSTACIFQKILKEGLNVRQAESAASQLKNPNAKASKSQKTLSNFQKKAQKTIADLLDVNVEVKTSANGKKGKIILDFKNEEELQHILSHIK